MVNYDLKPRAVMAYVKKGTDEICDEYGLKCAESSLRRIENVWQESKGTVGWLDRDGSDYLL